MFFFYFRYQVLKKIFIMPRAGLRNSLVEPPRPTEGNYE